MTGGQDPARGQEARGSLTQPPASSRVSGLEAGTGQRISAKSPRDVEAFTGDP